MSGKQYWKNQVPVILVNLLGLLALALFLVAGGSNIQSIVFIAFVWMAVLFCYLMIACFLRKRYLDRLLKMAEQLEEKYLIAEMVEMPWRADEQVFYRIMKMAEKSMLEKIEEVRRDRKEYKEYIEQWVHEAKTPITAMKLVCENYRFDGTRQVLAELENMNRFTEQALYYARSEHTEKDYIIREVNLADVAHEAIADNKYLLRRFQVTVTIDDMGKTVYTDDKWIRFMLSQFISNAVKYRAQHPVLRFYAREEEDKVLLFIEDNGIGIPESDLPRVFEKGFTGSNGRARQSATGIGLYLCKKLCDKLGIGIMAYSEGNGTAIVLSFQINDFVANVQG
ncbi:MAG: sensor histidine kinase [Lachnospiraceae bacterium]|nr:sensor histidine kinase [Lachnospiraceae bacterium]